MWILKKPSLQDAKADIKKLLQTCRGLEEKDKEKLEILYEEYDVGKGNVTGAQLSTLEDKKKTIESQYYKLSYKKGEEQSLTYIRRELMTPVRRCPYCSIGPPQHLDHYMPKSLYGQLAICRLNLVPLCGTCNNKKLDDEYNKYVHPYYQEFPKTPFLIAKCRVVAGKVVVNFDLDRAILDDDVLFRKVHHQVAIIDLNNRLEKEVGEFISQCFLGRNNLGSDGLEDYLEELHKECLKRYGINDWRTVVIRGLKICPDFTVDVVNNLRSEMVNGVGA